MYSLPEDNSAQIREEIVNYLEGAGIIQLLKSSLLSLYEERERPADPMEYIRCCFGTYGGEVYLRTVRARIAYLEAEIAKLKAEPQKK